MDYLRKERNLTALVEVGDVESLEDALIGERDISKKVAALCEAAQLDQRECVQVLLDADVDPMASCSGRTALYWAVRSNSTSIIQMMMDKYLNDLEMVVDANHRLHKKLQTASSTALYEAAAHGQTESVKVLLEYGVDPNVYAYHDHAAVSWSTPLIASCYAYMGQRDALERYCNTAKLLMQHGADVTKASCYRETALHYAVYNKMTDDVISMLLHNGADVNYPNGTGKTPLTCVTDSTSTIDLLLEWGADINAGDKDGWTALHYSAAEGHLKMVQHLLKNGANPNVIADFAIAPTTALALGIQSECTTARDIVKTLIQHSCDVNILSYPQNQPDGSPFFMACFYVFDSEMAHMISLGGAHRHVVRKCLDKPPFKNPKSQSDLTNAEAWHKLKESLKYPFTLKHCCRLKIRGSLGINFMKRKHLPLPPALITYLEMPDINTLSTPPTSRI